MGSMTLILAVFVAVMAISYVEAGTGTCPLPSKVYSCSPKCQQDYECTNGKVCCPNSCHAKSCSVAAAPGTGTGSSSKGGSGGNGVYCDNVKCNSHEICKLDPKTKRNKCSRS